MIPCFSVMNKEYINVAVVALSSFYRYNDNSIPYYLFVHSPVTNVELSDIRQRMSWISNSIKVIKLDLETDYKELYPDNCCLLKENVNYNLSKIDILAYFKSNYPKLSHICLLDLDVLYLDGEMTKVLSEDNDYPCAIAGVDEYFAHKMFYQATHKFKFTYHINAGLMIFNLKYISKDIAKDFVEYMSNATTDKWCMEQTYLNILYQDSIQLLHPKLNYTFLMDNVYKYSKPSMVHFIGCYKPYEIRQTVTMPIITTEYKYADEYLGCVMSIRNLLDKEFVDEVKRICMENNYWLKAKVK